MVQRTDLNLDNPLAADLRAPIAASVAGQVLNQESQRSNARRIIAEIRNRLGDTNNEQVAAILRDIDSIEAEVNNPLGDFSNIAERLNNIVTATDTNTRIARNNSSAEMGDAVTSLNGYRLSAAGELRVQRQIEAIRAGDIQGIIENTRSPLYDAMPDTLKAEVDAAAARQLESPQGRAILNAAARAQEEEPERFQQVMRDAARRREVLEQLIAAEQDPTRRAVLSSFLNSNAYAMPGSNNFIEAAQRGANVEELNAASGPVYSQLQQSIFGIVPTLRTTNPTQIDQIIAAAPEGIRDRLRTDDHALAVHLIGRARAITPEMTMGALQEYQRVGGDFSRLSPQSQEILAVNSVMASTTSTITIVGALSQLGRTQELMRAQEAGRALTPEEQQHVDNLNYISDTSNRLTERAERLVSATVGSLTSAPTPLLRRINDTRENSTALAAFTLAYADRNGGLERFQQMAARMPVPPATGPVQPEVQAYFNNYQNFITQALIGENINPADQSQGARLAVALGAAGKELQNGTMEIIDGPNGIRLYRPNSLDFAGTSSAFGSTDALLLQATGGTSAMVRNMYNASRTAPGNENPEFVRLIQQIDSYRLHTDPESQNLILDLQFQRRPLAEIRADLDRRLEVEREGMQAFVPSVMSRLEPRELEVFQRLNLLDANGQVDLARMMDQVEANKTRFADVYRDYLHITDPAQLPPGLADARVLREFASQLQSARSVEHLLVRRDAIEAELLNYQMSGAQVPPTLQAEADLIATIANYNPNSATPQETQAFESAMRNYMMRDTYIAEKENADNATPPPPRRANIVASATATIVDTLRADPLYFREHSAEHHELDHSHDSEVQQPSDATRVVSNYNPSTPLDERENEGSSGVFDGFSKTDLERAVLGVMQQMTTEVRLERFGQALGEANNTGDRSFISYNEIEAALIKNGWRRPADIDTDHNGVDDQDIIRALNTPNTAAAGQTNGRS